MDVSMYQHIAKEVKAFVQGLTHWKLQQYGRGSYMGPWLL